MFEILINTTFIFVIVLGLFSLATSLVAAVLMFYQDDFPGTGIDLLSVVTSAGMITALVSFFLAFLITALSG